MLPFWYGSGGPLHRETHYFRSPILLSTNSLTRSAAPSKSAESRRLCETPCASSLSHAAICSMAKFEPSVAKSDTDR